MISPCLDYSGFAHAARMLIRTLQQNPLLEVVARPLKYDQLDVGQQYIPPDWLKDALDKSITTNVDIVLQVTTCNVEAEVIPGVLNGLYTFFETNRLQPLWSQKAQSFDFLIVPSKHNAETLLRSGVTKPILVMGVPTDKDRFNQTYSKFDIKNSEGRTIFYNICQLSTKKRIDSLLRAYFAAFAAMPDEVLLVLKTYVNMLDRSKDLEMIKGYINMVKQKCRIPINKYPPVLPLVYTMSEDEICSLHQACDVYVNTSAAEGWNVPLFDSMCHGKTVISHQDSAMADYVTNSNALVYGGCQTLYYDMPHSDPGLYTGIEQCFEPSVAELAMHMQHYHLLRKGNDSGQLNLENQSKWNEMLAKRQQAKLLAERYDYRNVSPQITQQIISAYESWKLNGKVQFVDVKVFK